MYKAFALALLVGGVGLAVFGIGAWQSMPSDIARFFSGSPAEKGMWMVVCGVALFAVGLVGLVRGLKVSV